MARRTLVLDNTRQRPAWSVDEYHDPISCHYGIEGPEQALEGSQQYPALVMGDTAGNVFVQRANVNDNGFPIPGAIATFEYNGGDMRADQFWGDLFLDSAPPFGIHARPTSDRAPQAPATIIPAANERIRTPVKASGVQTKNMGVLVEWTDDYGSLYDEYDAPRPTKIYAWQPLYQAVPICVYEWKTQGTSFGFQGYMHIGQMIAAYTALADVTLFITTYDGMSPAPITLPSTGGQYRKTLVRVSANKGQLFFFRGVSNQPWRPYFDAWETYVGPWARSDAYRIIGDIESPKGIARSIT